MKNNITILIITICYAAQLTAMKDENSKKEEYKRPSFSLELHFDNNSSEDAEESLLSTLRERGDNPYTPLSPRSLEKELLRGVDTDSANNTSNSNSSRQESNEFIRVSNELIKKFPKMFKELQNSQKFKSANAQLQLAIVTNNRDLADNALERGANPAAKRINLIKLCGSPEKVEQEAKTKKYGTLIVGLCSLLHDAHEYRKLSMKKEDQFIYGQDVRKITSLVWQQFLEQKKK